MNDSRRLILFSKAPVPGKVKTRLFPQYSYEQAAALYQGWARDIYEKMSGMSWDVEVAYESSPEFPSPSWISFSESPNFFEQTGHGLGERLTHAFCRGFQEGAKKIVVIGTDSPGLPIRWIEEAFQALETDDAALGPAEDGGYYLIGLKRLLHELLEGIPWSTPEVYRETLKKARSSGYSVHALPLYYDIDVPKDFERYQSESAQLRTAVSMRG